MLHDQNRHGTHIGIIARMIAAQEEGILYAMYTHSHTNYLINNYVGQPIACRWAGNAQSQWYATRQP